MIGTRCAHVDEGNDGSTTAACRCRWYIYVGGVSGGACAYVLHMPISNDVEIFFFEISNDVEIVCKRSDRIVSALSHVQLKYSRDLGYARLQ